jgi:hypothetical protein
MLHQFFWGGFFLEEKMFFKEMKNPRCILFGMKTTKTEADWLRARALQEGISKSAFVPRLLARIANQEGETLSRRENSHAE